MKDVFYEYIPIVFFHEGARRNTVNKNGHN